MRGDDIWSELATDILADAQKRGSTQKPRTRGRRPRSAALPSKPPRKTTAEREKRPTVAKNLAKHQHG